MNWELNRQGDEFLYSFSEVGVALGFAQVEEQRDGLHADLTVTSTLPGQTGHLHYCRLNLASSSGRERLGTQLKRLIKEVEWPRILEIVCTKTVIEYRQGDPVVDLSQIPIPTGNAYLVKKILPEKVPTILFGDGGTAKSMVALAIGFIVHHGGWLPSGIDAVKSAKVMYLDWETCQEDQTERLNAIAQGLNYLERPSIFYRRLYRPLADESTRIRDDLRRNDIGLAIIDSLGYAAGGNPKEADVALATMNAIGKMGVTTLAIAHITKQDATENNKATPFGSAFYTFSARSTWEVRKSSSSSEDELNLALFHRKTNRGALQRNPIGLTLKFHSTEDDRLSSVEFHAYDVSDDPELVPFASLGYRLLAMLKQAKGAPLSTQAIAEEAKIKANTVATTLRRMNNVVNLGKGKGSMAMWALKAERSYGQEAFERERCAIS